MSDPHAAPVESILLYGRWHYFLPLFSWQCRSAGRLVAISARVVVVTFPVVVTFLVEWWWWAAGGIVVVFVVVSSRVDFPFPKLLWYGS